MAYISDSALDAALSYIRTNTTHLYILSAAPVSWTTWAQIEALMIASYSAPVISVPANGSPSGRAITISAIVDGVVDPGGGSASGELWVLVDATGEAALVAGEVTADQVLVADNTFTLSSFAITLPDPA